MQQVISIADIESARQHIVEMHHLGKRNPVDHHDFLSQGDGREAHVPSGRNGAGTEIIGPIGHVGRGVLLLPSSHDLRTGNHGCSSYGRLKRQMGTWSRGSGL